MLLAYRCALASQRVTAAAVEATEFAVAADRYGVVSVPAVVANARLAWVGNVAEAAFLEHVRRVSKSLP